MQCYFAVFVKEVCKHTHKHIYIFTHFTYLADFNKNLSIRLVYIFVILFVSQIVSNLNRERYIVMLIYCDCDVLILFAFDIGLNEFHIETLVGVSKVRSILRVDCRSTVGTHTTTHSFCL